jgi:hypothetical protein
MALDRQVAIKTLPAAASVQRVSPKRGPAAVMPNLALIYGAEHGRGAL